MTYRDDLEAALERADDLERELSRARGEVAADEKKIAELEQQLAEARKEAKRAKAAGKAGRPVEKPAEKKPDPFERAKEMLERSAATEAESPDAESPAAAKRNMVWTLVGLGALVALLIYGGITLQQHASSRSAAAPAPAPLAPSSGAPRPPAQPLVFDQFDVSGGYFVAVERAHKEFPDPELRSFSADYVDERGLAHLKYGGEVRYRFRSPSRAGAPEPPSNLPIGVPHPSTRPFCLLSVRTRDYTGYDVLDVSNGSDGETDCGTAIAPPRCTVAQVWQEARKLGAPAGALATEIKFDAKGWRFRIDDNGHDVFHKTIPDSCAP